MQKQRPTQLHKKGAGIMAVWLAWLPKVSAYWSKDGKWILGKEVEHWHDGHLGEFYKKPREKFGELASEFGKAFKHSPEHKHPLAPPWWQFVIMFTLVVVALIGCIIWKVMADAERRFVEARQGRQQQRAQVSQALRQPTRRSTARNRGAEVGSAASRGDAALSIDRIQEED